MIELKLTNGDVVRNLDDAHLTIWVSSVADMLMNQEITEIDVCKWLGTEAGKECSKSNFTEETVPEWKRQMMHRFNRKE